MTARGYEFYLRVFNDISRVSAAMMFRSYSNISKYFIRDYVTKALVIILVTMATPISSHVKYKNSMFTACDEDMIFAHGCYVIFMSLVGSPIALTHSLTHSILIIYSGTAEKLLIG